MKKWIALCLFLFSFFANVAFAAAPEPKKEEMPEAFKQWEQVNAPREANEEARYGQLWNKTLMLLIFILLILFVGTWYLKRFGPMRVKDSGNNQRIQLLDKRVISPKAVIYLLSIDGHKVAISETSSGIQVLQELSRMPKPFSLEPIATSTKGA